MSDERHVTRSEMSGRDVDQARNYLQNEYNGDDFLVEPTTADFSFRYSSVGDDELTLRGSLFHGSVRGSIRTHGEYVVSWITAGTGATDLGGDIVRLAHGQPAMFVNDRSAEFDFSDYRQNLMHFDGAFLERVAAEHEGADGPLLFDTRSRPTGNALQKWASTVSSVARVIYDTDSPALLRSEANRSAAIALLDTFPHLALTTSTSLALPASGRLRVAVEYLYAHAHLPVHVEDVARAAGIGLRALQLKFRRELNTTPQEYLRHIRLDRVHAELLHGEPGTTTVGEVAQRWGFVHLGRFAASYAHRFGEYPRTTLDGTSSARSTPETQNPPVTA